MVWFNINLSKILVCVICIIDIILPCTNRAVNVWLLTSTTDDYLVCSPLPSEMSSLVESHLPLNSLAVSMQRERKREC